MNNTKHTPGPWQFVNGRQIRSEKHQIGQAWMMRNGEGVVNGRLMASAPELLEALEALERDYADLVDSDYSGTSLYEEMMAPAYIARAVLAKARGEA